MRELCVNCRELSKRRPRAPSRLPARCLFCPDAGDSKAGAPCNHRSRGPAEARAATGRPPPRGRLEQRRGLGPPAVFGSMLPGSPSTAGTDHILNKTHETNRKCNLPLSESDRGRITLSIFLALRVEFERMGESDSVAIVARAIASSPRQAPAPSARRMKAFAAHINGACDVEGWCR